MDRLILLPTSLRTSSIFAYGACALLAIAAVIDGACTPAPPPQKSSVTDAPTAPFASNVASASPFAPEAGPTGLSTPPSAGAGSATALTSATARSTPLHRDSREELLSLFSIKDFTEKERKRIRPNEFLRSVFGTDGPRYANQGNKAIAQHRVSREQCRAALRGITIQTPEQRAKCGAENMVPIWTRGKEPWFCIDVFEFPNKACELPVVWIPPTSARKVCELQGKRLCSDIEWNIACRGDPNGGEDRRYAYGNKVDIDICHTNLRHRQPCVVKNAKTTWDTCTTDTEPSGSFPKCRSRFGVFDQHGNVAEIMMRRESAKRVVTQLKGSAWFYTELVKEPGEPVPATTTNKAGAYPDHCNFDPRWHVEPIEAAMHVNYHLGFRCCKSIP